MKYAIHYEEVYSDVYYISADSYEEARDKLQNAIQDGAIEGPKNCTDSQYEDITESMPHDITDDDIDL